MTNPNKLSYNFNVTAMLNLVRSVSSEFTKEETISIFVRIMKTHFNITVETGKNRYVYTFESEDEKIEFFLKYSEHIKDVILVENIDNVQKII